MKKQLNEKELDKIAAGVGGQKRDQSSVSGKRRKTARMKRACPVKRYKRSFL